MPIERGEARRPAQTPPAQSVEHSTGSGAQTSTEFSVSGALPAVASGGAGATSPTASERAFGQTTNEATGNEHEPGKLPKGEAGFEKMWNAHPHAGQADETQNTESSELLGEHGLPASFANTCAIRLSIMLNGIGETITPAKTKAAGLARKPHYSKTTKLFYILGASEMWTYLSATFRKPDVEFPATGRFKDATEFDAALTSKIKPATNGKRGIVAFDKIFSYGGTGHVDLFDGDTLSDSSSWYQSARVQLWYI